MFTKIGKIIEKKPGLIIGDVIKQICESTIIIGDITPANRKVYYDVGYAHGAGKETILICECNTDVPFDLSGFQILFYENSIGGKKRFEEGPLDWTDD